MRSPRRTIVHRDTRAYSSHPCVASLDNGDWVVAFSSGTRQARTFHPPDHPDFVNRMVRSSDQGASWSGAVIVPAVDWVGVETPGITQLSSGVMLVNQWRFRWFSTLEATARWARGDRSMFAYDPGSRRWSPAVSTDDWDRHPFEYARADDGAYVHRSFDRGLTWPETSSVSIAPYRGAFSPKGACELANGDVLLALGSHDYDPRAACFVVRSTDDGHTWGHPTEVARLDECTFSEPSLCRTASGKLIMLSREEQRGFLYQSDSHDDGFTWTTPEPFKHWGYPAHVVPLHDGRVLAVYGYRRIPFGIRASISSDDGITWSDEIVLIDDLPGTHGWNVGYPSAIEYSPDEVFIAYYGDNTDGLTFIHGLHLDV